MVRPVALLSNASRASAPMASAAVVRVVIRVVVNRRIVPPVLWALRSVMTSAPVKVPEWMRSARTLSVVPVPCPMTLPAQARKPTVVVVLLHSSVQQTRTSRRRLVPRRASWTRNATVAAIVAYLAVRCSCRMGSLARRTLPASVRTVRMASAVTRVTAVKSQRTVRPVMPLPHSARTR